MNKQTTKNRPAAMPALTKFTADLARIQTEGVKNMAEITRMLGKVYPTEGNTKEAVHTAQTLKAAGITTEVAEMQTAIEAHFDNGGVKLSDAMIQQGLKWLLNESKKRSTPMCERETNAVQSCGGIVWSNVYAHYSQRTGQTLYYVPVFTVYDAQCEAGFDYYVLNGKIEICG